MRRRAWPFFVASVLWLGAASWLAFDQWAHQVDWAHFSRPVLYILVAGVTYEFVRSVAAHRGPIDETSEVRSSAPPNSDPGTAWVALILMFLTLAVASTLAEFGFRARGGEASWIIWGRVAVHLIFGGIYLALCHGVLGKRELRSRS